MLFLSPTQNVFKVDTCRLTVIVPQGFCVTTIGDFFGLLLGCRQLL